MLRATRTRTTRNRTALRRRGSDEQGNEVRCSPVRTRRTGRPACAGGAWACRLSLAGGSGARAGGRSQRHTRRGSSADDGRSRCGRCAGPLGAHGPQVERSLAPGLADAHLDRAVGLPVAEVVHVRHDARSRLQPDKLRPQLHVDVRPQEQRHHRGCREVRLEQVALDELHAVGDVRALRVRVGFGDSLRIDVDPYTPRAEIPCGSDHDPAVAGTEVVDDVAAGDAREFEHRANDFRWRRLVRNVRCPRRRLRPHDRRRRDGGTERERGAEAPAVHFFAAVLPIFAAVAGSGTVQKYTLRVPTFAVLSGFQSPMSKSCDTMRVPGFSLSSVGRSLRFSAGSRYSVMTVAGLRSSVNRSPWTNFTLSPTPEFLRFSFASLMRSGSMSMPRPRVPNFFAAVMGMRPSPDPRS